MHIRKVMVTGANGFVGGYLTKYLKQQAFEVIELPARMDLRDIDAIRRFCSDQIPDAVVHLAAQSFVPKSFDNPQETYEINFLGTYNLLESLKLNGFKGAFLYIGSSDVYGVVPESRLPITEETLLCPRSPYAVSKASAEFLCRQWSVSESGWRLLITRPFNHIGAGQAPNFVISGFCRQVARIALGVQEPVIDVGNLDVTRDFTDVRDVIRAYVLLLENGENGEIYNICSGQEVILSEILPKLREISGINFDVNVRSDLCRPAEQRRVCGSFKKLNGKTGWKPEILFNQTLLDIYHYWLEETKVELK